MNSNMAKDLTFSDWTQKTCQKHADTLASMLKSHNPLDRVIAKQILKEAGVKPQN